MKNYTNIGATIVALTFACTSVGFAATISSFGTIVNNSGSQISEFRTNTTSKILDIDGDNIYGTFGGISFGDAVVGNMAFVSSQTQVGPFAGYDVVDDINGGVDRQVKTTSNGAAGGTDVVMYTFRVTAAVATTDVLRIGIALDGLDNVVTAPASIGVRESVGPGTFEVATSNINNTLDMYFFDVSGGVAANTQFQVFADAGVGNFVTHQIVTLDVAAAPSGPNVLNISMGESATGQELVNGEVWNNLNGLGGATGSLLFADGSSAGATTATQNGGGFNPNDVNGNGYVTGLDTVTQSLVFDGTTGTVTLVIDNLDVNSKWDVDVFAGLDEVSARAHDIDVNGTTLANLLFGATHASGAPLTFSGIVATSGTITITASNGVGNVEFLQAVTLTQVPAPAALPAGLAMLGLAAARRRRK